MNVGLPGVFPQSLVSHLTEDKASHEAGCAQLGAGGLQGHPNLSQSCLRREQQEALAVWAVPGRDQIPTAPAQGCITPSQSCHCPSSAAGNSFPLEGKSRYFEDLIERSYSCSSDRTPGVHETPGSSLN